MLIKPKRELKKLNSIDLFF